MVTFQGDASSYHCSKLDNEKAVIWNLFGKGKTRRKNGKNAH